jgi:hypothetical protein
VRHRDTHYFLWFIFFGVLSGIIHYVNQPGHFDPESTWLTVSGLLGMLFGARWLANGKLSRGYDFIIGVIFTLAGAIGIAAGFHVDLISGPVANGLISQSELLGLSLATLPSLVHAVLGITSLNHVIHNK